MISKIHFLKRGDIVLVPFPFTDLSSTKVRPAVIVSSDPQKNDVIIAFISSVTDNIHACDVLLKNSDPHFAITGLKKESVFKMDKILTIASILIARKLGHTHASFHPKLDQALKTALDLR
ncbi:MAG: type II toxin-antitoxin system PemK/MazF family toxin [Candidatus Omnitrophica bacterium]|nr:type II toxin-antitoxin system PemK/MazF family toxin [Candidatus Omnitrophota bacterium]